MANAGPSHPLDTNPYDWQSNVPQTEILRAEVDEVSALLLEGSGAVVLGGRGMGKSVFLGQLEAHLENVPDIAVRTIRFPPPELTVRECLDSLARVLDQPAGAFNTLELVETFLARDDTPERLVLLFDEFDNYAEIGEQISNRPAGRAFFNDLEAARRSLPGLGILAAGSIGIFVFRDVLGSSFLSRARLVRLAPFSRRAIAELAKPFAVRGESLGQGVLEALDAATGGIPALLAHGLQELWRRPESPDERQVARIFIDFERHYRGYLDDIRQSLSHRRLSQAPLRVWREIRKARGRVSRKLLVAACQGTDEALALELPDVLDILQATGLIAVQSTSYAADPILAHPTASLLNLPEASEEETSFTGQLLADLQRLLEMLHRSAADFYRLDRDGNGKQLVPEAVFAAHLVLGFELLGWKSEREAQSAAGRSDLKLWHNGSPERAVVELKIWGRNDFKEAHHQIESYWTRDVAAGVVVQLTDADLSDWPERYRQDCLAGLRVEELELGDSPIRAAFACDSQTPDGQEVKVHHFLLRLPRRF